VSDQASALLRSRIAQLFDRHPERDSFIGREIAQRMGERLAYIRVAPQRLLDLGCGSGADWALLAERFPEAFPIGVDLSLQRLVALRRRETVRDGWLRRALGGRASGAATLCADYARLPLGTASVDMIWSNLAIHWDDQPHLSFKEWGRVLEAGGLVMFSAFGPDTLAQVRRAFAAVDALPHTLAFTDMHDYGDMLVAAGFATPVVDMEHITLTYSSAQGLWDDVRALGGNPLVERRGSLWGRRRHRLWSDALESQRGTDGLLRLTFEVLYGHAWKGIPRTVADGRSVVRIERLSRSTPQSRE
jgi:malonyl-CoA O-methyltransferase